MAFVQRQISVTLTLADGSTVIGQNVQATKTPLAFSGGASTLTLNASEADPTNQLRISVHMDVPGGNAFAKAMITIYGMTESEMAAASTYSKFPLINKGASVTVMAGDAKGGMFLAFKGTIQKAWAAYNEQPEVGFRIESQAGLDAAMTVIAPTSVKGTTTAAAMLQSLAKQIGYSFENNSGIAGPRTNPYHRGSVRDQITAICAVSRLQLSMLNNTVAIWPSGQPRNLGAQAVNGTNGTAVTISYLDSTMIGYPEFYAAGIFAKALYNPGFVQGVLITVVSTLTPACGKWGVNTLAHDIEANVPGGKWETIMQLSVPGDTTLSVSA